MDKTSARQQAMAHLSALVADCNEALGASDVWADYSPKDRAKSLALFQQRRDAASRLLAQLQADEPIARADWKRVIPPDAGWTDVYKALSAQAQDEGNDEGNTE